MIIDNDGYLARRTSSRIGGHSKNNKHKKVFRNWWFIKHLDNKNCGQIGLKTQNIYIPKEYVGKKIRFKLEVKVE